jgi:hypothetical protein
MLKNIYYKQGYNSVNGPPIGTTPGSASIGSSVSQRKSFFDKRNNTEKTLNLEANGEGAAGANHQNDNVSLSGLSEIGMGNSSAP